MSLLTDHLDFGNIYFNDKTYSPDTIRAGIDAVAENLTKRFISNSPFVYLFAPNHIKTVYALFGILKAGRICVLVDPALGHFEVEEMIKDAAPGAIIRIEKSTDTFDFFKEIEVKHYQLSPSRLQGLEDVAIMLYTAADDGFAKGAMLTHENLLANARALVESNNVNNKSVTCSLIAFNHLFALQTGIITPLITAGNVVIEDISRLSSIKKISDDLVYHKVTHVYAVPFVYYYFKKMRNNRRIFSSVKSVSSGGIKLFSKIFENFLSNFGIAIHEGYGLSEASPMCAWHKPDDEIKINTVGRAFPFCQATIMNEENFELPTGRIGEICVKGANVMKGYFNNDLATKRAIINGWLHTGDLGRMDNEGYVYLTGLKKRMLNVAGNKVYPTELERLMHKNDNVLNVQVYGEPDELMGDTVKARVHLQKTTNEDQKKFEVWCSENITRYKVPRSFEYV